ncbi:MAG: PAS domain S-box protein, partial [Flavobacteriales bacterium]|nr:PAS domain S-box protein [Flavobacteriales bacterium]
MIKQQGNIEVLREESEWYKLAVSTANIGVWDWEISSDTVYYSKIWKAQVGYQEDELANTLKTWEELLHPDDAKGIKRRVSKYLENPEGKYVNEFRFRHKNGSYIWILAKAEVCKDADGNVTRMIGSHTDITRKKEAELQLKSISDQSSEGITIADMDGNYVFVNPAFCKMSGYTEEELLTMTVFDMKAPNQDHSSFQKTKKSSQIISLVLQKKDGTEYFSEIIGDVITVQNKKLVLGTIRDVTVRVNAEMKVEELNENLELLITQRTKELDETVIKLNSEIEHRILVEKQI